MTSVKRASPQQLLAWNRGHWVVESHHHVRDATFREDDSMLRTRPQTTRSSTPSQSPSSSATNASCPNPSTASSTPATTMPTSASRSCTQSQDQADRASLPDRNCKLSSPATKASRSPRIRRPIAPRAVTARQTSANLKIAASNASTRATIRTPITSHQQAWDHLGVGPDARSPERRQGGCPSSGCRQRQLLHPSWHFSRPGIFIALRDFLSADFNMALHPVEFCQLVRRLLVRRVRHQPPRRFRRPRRSGACPVG